MRTSRALFAGFGTTSAMLAASACVFFVASALVAFNGWPVGNMIHTTGAVQAPPVRDVAYVTTGPRQVASAGSRAAAGVAAVPHGPAVARAGDGTARISAGHGNAANRVSAHGHASATTLSSTDKTTTDAKPTSKVPSLSNVLNDGRTTAANTLTSVGDHVGDTVSRTGARVGDGVKRTGDRVGDSVSKLSPQLATTVKHTTTSVDHTVSSTSALVGTLVSHAGESLGHALGGR